MGFPIVTAGRGRVNRNLRAFSDAASHLRAAGMFESSWLHKLARRSSLSSKLIVCQTGDRIFAVHNLSQKTRQM